MGRHGETVPPHYIIAVFDDDVNQNKPYQTYSCHTFEEAYTICVNILARWSEVVIDVFMDRIRPDSLLWFAYRQAENVYLSGRGPDGNAFNAVVNLANQESSVTSESS